MNRLGGAKQASLGETSCLPQKHVARIKCSKTSDKPRTLPWAIITNGGEMGLSQSDPCSEPRKVHRNQILVTRLKLKSGLSREMERRMAGNWHGSREDDHDPFHCTPHHSGTWQPHWNHAALLPDWIRNKDLTSEEPIRVPSGVTRRESNSRRTH